MSAESSKHRYTPGPWHCGGATGCTVYDQFSQRVADSFEGVIVTQRSDEQCRSNARLIAAAPALVEALDELLSYVEGGGNPREAARLKARAALKAAGVVLP